MTVITRNMQSHSYSAAPAERAMGVPILIGSTGGSPILERIAIDRNGVYDEAWLQDLLFDHPQLLPITQIEPAFGALIPVATEVACGHGSIDNLYVTPTGELVLVEAKLWRNPEARRKVLAQTLDYVTALQTMSYSAFEQAVVRAAGQGAGRGSAPAARTLHQLVADHPDALEEAPFIDAVSHNLRRGRILALIVGDGIHRETELLAEMFADRMGAHFSLALVEIATYRNLENGDILAVPSTLLKTRMVERGVVLIEDGAVAIKPVQKAATPLAQTISEDMFYETLGKKEPHLPRALRHFLAGLEGLGVYAILGKSLALKVDIPEEEKPLTLGYITRTGQLWTEGVTSSAPLEPALRYLETLAALVGGSVKLDERPYATTNGSSAPRVAQLLPLHGQAWGQAAADLIEAARRAAGEGAR